MKYTLLATLATALFISCSQNENREIDYVFDKSKAKNCEMIEKCILEDVCLDMGDDAAKFTLPQLFLSGDDMLVSSMDDVLRFGKDGKMKNRIGEVGRAAGEYVEMLDWCLDPSGEHVEIMDTKSIYSYDLSSKFVSKQPLPISAVAFVKTSQHYWFATGRNGYDAFTLFRTDHQLGDIKKYNEAEAVPIPVKEKNFGKGTWLTYKESFTHDVLRIEDGEPSLAHRFSFKGLEIPEGMFTGDMMDMIRKMSKQPYAMIHTYLENDNLVFMLVQEYRKGLEEEPVNYWWVIDKEKQEDVVLSIPEEYMDMYGNPQTLTGKGVLFLVSFQNPQQDADSSDTYSPHVIKVDLTNIGSADISGL